LPFREESSVLSTSSQVLPGVYTWAFPGSPIQIRVHLAVVDELQRGLAQPGSSREGGVLIGVTPRFGITEITGFQAASPLDAESIEVMIGKASGKVVGYYRIDRSGSLTLDSEDLYLASAYFHDPSSVILRIQAKGPETPTACFFFWDNEQIQGDLPFMEVPFDRDQLAIAEQQRQLSQPAKAESLPAMPLEVTPPMAFREAMPRHWPAMWPRLALGIMAVAAIGVSAVYLYSNRRALPRTATVATVSATNAASAAIAAVPKSDLAFTVERRGADLLLSWNREASILSNATFGMLLIRAQNASRDISLTPEQLRLGSILYAPTTDQVEIQLNVVAGERVARDSLIVLLPRKGEKGPVVTTVQRVDAAIDTVQPVANLDERRNGPTQVEHSKPFVEPVAPRTNGMVTPPSITELPPRISSDAGPLASVSFLDTQLAAPAVPAVPLANTNAEPKPASQTKPIAQAIQSPVPIEKVMPRVPEQLKNRLSSAKTVQVSLTIDAAGKVVKAEALAAKDSSPYLDQAAVAAARLWRFRPALINDQPVPSTATVQFNFSPTR
jgi:protein TonB